VHDAQGTTHLLDGGNKMSIISDEVSEALRHFKPSPVVYELGIGYGNSLNFGKVSRPISSKEDIVTSMISARHAVEEILNIDTGKHEIHFRGSDIANNIRWEVHKYLTSFINRNGDSKNNKLTNLYRWFNGAIAAHVMMRNPDLESDLWNIFKWLKGLESEKDTSAQYRSAIQLLEVICQRYEAKGIKV
jgi:hypothetical protein